MVILDHLPSGSTVAPIDQVRIGDSHNHDAVQPRILRREKKLQREQRAQDNALTFRQRLTQTYGARTGALMACAISHDDPMADCKD